MRVNRRHGGFTLLELTISIALAAVIFTILFGGLSLVENARRRGEGKLDEMAQDLALREAVDLQVSSAVPRVLAMDYEGQQLRLLSFRGSSKEVRFLTRTSWAGGRNVGQWLATYRVVKQPDGQEQLVIAEVGISDDRDVVANLRSSEPPRTPTVPVGKAADRIEFSYLRPSAPGKPSSWVPEWKAEAEKTFPRAIRLQWSQGKQEQSLTLPIPVIEETK